MRFRLKRARVRTTCTPAPTTPSPSTRPSKNKDAAKAFLAWAAQPEQTKAFAEIDGALPVSGLDKYDFEGGAYKNVGDLIKNGNYGPLPEHPVAQLRGL